MTIGCNRVARFGACALMTLLGATSISNADIVYDDFTGGSIDNSKWTTSLPHSSSALSLSSNRLRFQGRAFLNSIDDWDPVTDPVTVSGRWEFGNIDDFLQIATRSEGVPNSFPHENKNALELWIRPSAGEFRIHQFVNGSELNIFTMPISIQAGDIFDFEVFDDGSSFSVNLTEVGGEGVSAFASVNTALDTGFKKVTIHNRETAAMFGYLHEITIENVPTPGASMVMLSAAGIAGIRRRR